MMFWRGVVERCTKGVSRYVFYVFLCKTLHQTPSKQSRDGASLVDNCTILKSCSRLRLLEKKQKNADIGPNQFIHETH